MRNNHKPGQDLFQGLLNLDLVRQVWERNNGPTDWSACETLRLSEQQQQRLCESDPQKYFDGLPRFLQDHYQGLFRFFEDIGILEDRGPLSSLYLANGGTLFRR